MFEKYSEINSMKTRLLGTELFHADGKTRRSLSQFCERA